MPAFDDQGNHIRPDDEDRRRFTLYRVNAEHMTGRWNVAEDQGPPSEILGMPVEVVEVVERDGRGK